ncbi:hypothetical protein BDQ17DRAFT_1336048 [Cyathus striatus]|nr:hypothetical protein BDQ17DRAFT_1336048 [Cyathus striatus]
MNVGKLTFDDPTRRLQARTLVVQSVLVNVDTRHWEQPARNEHSIHIGWEGGSVTMNPLVHPKHARSLQDMLIDVDIDTRRGTQQTGGNGKRWIGIGRPLSEQGRKEEGRRLCALHGNTDVDGDGDGRHFDTDAEHANG